jgi:hypothetical protein
MTTTRAMKPGGEVDAWCTKCRMDLLHRIIAMNGGKIVRVECRTCGGHHNYHRPKSAGPEHRRTDSSPATKTAASRASSEGGARAGSARRTFADQAERERTASWEKTVLGQPVTKFKPYRPTAVFENGDLIRHAKFGDGYIMRVIDRQKIEAMFKDGARTLAQALEA